MSKKWQKKNLVCETEVWSLADRVKNLNAGIRHPSKLSIIDGAWTPALKLLPSGSPQIRWRRTEGAEFSFLTSDTDVKKKKLILPPLTSQSKISFKKLGLTDRGMATNVLVENDFFKKMKKTWSVRLWYGYWR